MRPFRQLVLLFFALALPGACLRAAPPPIATAPSLQVSGAVLQPGAWDAARLRHDLAVTPLTYSLKGKRHTAHCVSLFALLTTAQPRFNPNIKNHRLQFVVLVRGRDGYTAAFSLAELSPDLGRGATWLALDEDGQPLGADDGPAQLIVPGDARPSRWVHSVAAIIVRDEAAMPDRP